MKKKVILLSLGVMLLAGCSQGVNPIEVSNEQLNQSISKLLAEDNTYENYVNLIDDGKYVASSYKQELNPIGGTEKSSLQDSSIQEGYSNKEYAKIITANETINYQATLEDKAKGRYTLKLEYRIPESFSASALIDIKINGQSLFNETDSVTLPLLYEDNISYVEEDGKMVKNFNDESNLSKYGDQLYPKQKRYDHDDYWQNESLYETTYKTSDPLIFDLDVNNLDIAITNLSDDYFYIGKLTLVPYTKLTSNIDYVKDKTSKPEDTIEINATSYIYKNNNEARISSEQTPSVTPYEAGRKLLNVIYSWEESGQSITYEFDVKTAGLYPITLHYYNSNDNFPSFRTVEIDGKVPSKEFKNYRLESTGSKYANETLHDENGNPLYVYLTAGTHQMTLTATTEPSYEIYKNLMAVYDSINDLAIQIRKFTGANVDSNRVYDVLGFITDLDEYLQAYRTIIYDSYNKIKEIVGNDSSSSALSYFPRMIELIDEFIEKPNDIPVNLTKFSSGDSCLGKLVADTANTILTTPVILDTIYLTNDVEGKVRKANASWTSSFKDSLVNLGQTFTSDKYKNELVDGELNIWSGRSQAYNDILQNMADTKFTPATGIKVNIRQMPSEDNLIYAYAANTVPDLVLGINSGRAYEFALRGDAAYPMSDFEDYYDVISEYDIPVGQLMSMLYQDKFYSIPESTSVELMFYRTDIMNVIGENNQPMDPPETWQELTGQLKRIQARDMNFYYSASASGSLKSLESTAEFILQNGGTLLSDDGFTMNLRSTKTFEALKLLTNLYTIYSLPTEVGSFYNSFRYGTMPIGIGDLGMYLSLKYIAPELSGKWAVTQIPGIAQEEVEGHYADLNKDGTEDEISRWFISNGSSAMIFNNSKMIDEAWTFLKWWLSDEIQIEYTESLQSTFGPSVIWFSANRNAAAKLPVDRSVRDVVLDQLNWICDLQQIPGQYMLQRGLSDIWNTVVFGTSSDGTSTGKVTIANAIDLEKVIVDREIQRKMEEFGFYDTTNNVAVKEYLIRDYSWVYETVQNGKTGKEVKWKYGNN